MALGLASRCSCFPESGGNPAAQPDEEIDKTPDQDEGAECPRNRADHDRAIDLVEEDDDAGFGDVLDAPLLLCGVVCRRYLAQEVVGGF
jgi:hypothetical protein